MKVTTAKACGNILIQNLTVYYRSTLALSHINLQIDPGKLVGVIGPNGAGKSTLIKAMLGLIPATQGQALYQGQPLYNHLDHVAYVPQRSAIDWTYPATVWDVVMMGRVKKTGWFRPFASVSKQLALKSLDRVGLLDYLKRPIGELSGGQQQRVFLARSLATEAQIYCFDEPFVGVDQKTETILFEVFTELAQTGAIVIVVNHDLGESITHFDQLILLNRELIHYGSVADVLQPDHMNRAYGGQVLFYQGAVA
jgi:manganese/iron transport system ATP-binding protein